MKQWVYQHYLMGIVLIEGIVAVYGAIFLLPNGMPTMTLAMIILASVIPWVLLYSYCARKLNLEAIYAFDEQCDPEPLLELSLDTLRQIDPKGKKRKTNVLIWRVNKVAALAGLGRYEQAWEELEHIGGQMGKLRDVCTLLYHENRAAVAYELGRREEMERSLHAAEGLLRSVKLTRDLRETCEVALQTNRCALRLLQEGPGSDVEGEYAALLERPLSLRARVGTRFALARCAAARGDNAAAREHLYFVLDRGNRLDARRQAEDLMAKLN